MTRLLLANPNTTQAMTDRLARVARATAPAGVEIEAITAPRGFPYISSLAEAQVSGTICLEMLAAAAAPDAAIIAAFGDPGLEAAREILPFPVVGMAEAAILTAVQLGRRFAIVTFTPAMAGWYRASVASLGLEARFVGLRCPQDPVGDVVRAAEVARDQICALCQQAARDGADTVILGGAPLAGLAQELSAEVPALLVDPISAALHQALALAAVATSPQTRLARPAAKASTGLAAPLAALFAQSPPPKEDP